MKKAQGIAFQGPLLVALLGALIVVGALLVFREVGSAPPVSAAKQRPVPGSVVAFMGDSYFADGQEKAIPVLVGDRFSWSVLNTSVGGTGYVNGGSRQAPYGAGQFDRVVAARPVMVVIYGSRNDLGQPAITDAASSLYHRLAEALPASQIIVVGPAWTSSIPDSAILAVRDSVAAAARAEGLPFVDPIAEGWLGADPRWIGPDGVHPSASGRARMASILADDLVRLGWATG